MFAINKLVDVFSKHRYCFEMDFNEILNAGVDLQKDVILEFGCGSGSKCLLFPPINYVGVDCNPDNIDSALRAFPHYDFRTIQNNRLPVSDNTIDFVIVFFNFCSMSIPECSDVINEFKRVLGRNGRIMAVEPCISGQRYSKSVPFNNNKIRFFRNEKDYMDVFSQNSFELKNVKLLKHIADFDEIIFTAVPKQKKYCNV